MRQRCIVCGMVLEPSKENEITQIEFLKINGLPPSELCTQLISTLGTCKDGGHHETTFEPEDRQRMANIIVDYDSEVSLLGKERQHNVELVTKREEIILSLRQIGNGIRNSAEKIVESEIDIETILTDYEAISSTKDIEFYRMTVSDKKEEVKEEKPEDKK